MYCWFVVHKTEAENLSDKLLHPFLALPSILLFLSKITLMEVQFISVLAFFKEQAMIHSR
jgi:hypothetical protein